MNWTKRKPKMDGWYWIRLPGNVWLTFGNSHEDKDGKRVIELAGDRWCPWPITATKGWQFAGPIPEPEE